jgi:hypothetical protein
MTNVQYRPSVVFFVTLIGEPLQEPGEDGFVRSEIDQAAPRAAPARETRAAQRNPSRAAMARSAAKPSK